MAKAYASVLIEAPVEAVWAAIRDFNGLPSWHPAIVSSEIENGLDADAVGCVRSFRLADGGHARERLLSLDDSFYRFSYNFETPPFPVENYVAAMEVIPVTKGDHSFVQWSATFDETPADAGKYVEIISTAVFGGGLAALADKVKGRAKPEGAERWRGLRPAKVFCSSVIAAPAAEVWAVIRDFAGMGGWHPDVSRMSMIDGVRSDKVSGVRDFHFGEGQLWEQLTYLSDSTHEYRYRILKSGMPWLNYHAGPRLYPITAGNKTFAVWTADWTASANDDVTLIPLVHEDVFQKAFDTLASLRFAAAS